MDGVIDPFIQDGITRPGQAFWVFLNPEIVESLVHHFEIQGRSGKEPWEDRLATAEKERDELKAQLKDATDELEADSCRGCYN
jgi:hypothetical protein